MSVVTKTIRQTRFFPGVKPAAIYSAMLDGRRHGEMTGGAATCEAKVGGRFTAWDGYISGTNLELGKNELIVQSWATSQWPAGAPPSRLRWSFKEENGGTRVAMVHSDVPASQADSYRKGWVAYYWDPMKEYFSRR